MFRINHYLHLVTIGLLFSLSFAVHADTLPALFHKSGDPIAGHPKGDITIVEFFDYQCGHCAAMNPIMQNIIKANPDVRVVFKEFPIRGTLSELAARAALAANKQGKYGAFSHALLATNQPLTEETIMTIAKSSGLSLSKLKNDMNSLATTKALRANAQLAQQLNINGTPAFFIGKTNAKDTNAIIFVLGEMSQPELQAAIDKAKA